MLYLIHYSDIIMLKRFFFFFCYYYKYYVNIEEIQNIIYYNFKFLNDIILLLLLFKLIFDLKIL